MSEAIKKSDIVQGDPFKEISNDIASTLGSLEQFDKALKSIASTMVNDLGKASAKTVQDIEAINKAEIESEKLLQQKLRTQKLQIDLEAKNQRLKEQQAKAIERAAKATASEVREAEKANSIYTRVDRKLAGMVKTYRDLAIRKELGAKLTAKEQREYDYLQGKIQKYDAALKTVDATMGKHQRNVGNYASGTAQLNFSVTQLAREMPAFANSVQTGFMAISNNLPMFFDEIGRLKTANAELAAAGKPTQSVFKSLAGSLMSTQVLLSVGVTLLTLYGSKLVEWASNLGGVNKAAEENARITKIRNEDAKKSRQYVAEESAEFVGNIMMLKATNAGSAERAKLIKEINEEYGSTIQNLKDEKKFQAQLNAEVNNYIEFQKIRYKLMRNEKLIELNLDKQSKIQSDISKATKEEIRLQKELKKAQEESASAQQQVVTGGGTAGGFGGASTFQASYEENVFKISNALKEQQRIISEGNAELKAAEKRLEQYGIVGLSASQQIEKFGYKVEDSGEKTVKAQKEINTAFKYGNEYVSKYIQLNQELIQIQQGRTITQHKENIDAMLANEVKSAEDTGQAQVDELERVIHEMYVIQAQFIEQQRDFKLKAIEDEYQREKTLRLKALQDERDDLLKGAEGNTDAQAKINANYQVKLTALNKEEETRYKDVQKEKEVVTAETVDKVTGLKQEEYDEINRVNNEIFDAQIDFADKTNATNQKTHDEDMKLIKERYEVIMSVQQSITDAIQYQIDRRIELLQKESDAAAKQQDFLQNLAANGNIYAQQSIAEQIRIQREAQQEQLRLERAKQSVELVSTGLKTFESALSEGKTPAEALASTIVNTQVLTSFLKNLQFYESGTMNAPGGLSVVDEKGAELITDRRGNIKEIGTGKGARFTTLSPGDRVYTATQTSALLNSFEGAATMSQMPKANGAGLGFDTAILTRELKELQNIVANKSESNVHWQSFSSGIAEIVQSKQVGGRKITNRFRVK